VTSASGSVLRDRDASVKFSKLPSFADLDTLVSTAAVGGEALIYAFTYPLHLLLG
jgi:hypothetical protein